MDIKHIKELIAILEDSKLNKLTLKDKDGSEIHLEKSPQAPAAVHVPQQMVHQPVMELAQPAAPAGKQVQATTPQESAAKFITSPMVGTFYSSSSPDDPPFVKVGDEVDEGTIVCIVEAMKVMNEVKAGKSGKVVEVCVDNAHPVEFGTKLFRIE
ncbi:MAG: Biotin carboxyl carrier protein of acetyl-CoA carboxylase [Chlamydiia bacterium]|nr:Biotin carboxyl carrier protein of acetyl-CoA carboxylase [Chlamydiia bacterium]